MPDRRAFDDKSGVLVPPTMVKPHETSALLSASYTLDDQTAEILRLFISASVNGFALFDFLFSRLVILWIVTEGGDIRFCLEEACVLERPEVRYPRIRQMPNHGSITPLGHPTLIGGADGRIAGEIVLDVDDAGYPVWTLNNQSARYGVHPTRERSHLENVAAVFGTYGIDLAIHYIGPFR